MRSHDGKRKLLPIVLVAAMFVNVIGLVAPIDRVQASGVNSIYSEDFESGSVLTAHSGTGTMENRAEAENDSYLMLTGLSATQLATPEIQVQANTEYSFSYWVKASNTSGSLYFYALGQQWDDSGSYSGVEAAPGAVQADTDGWQMVQASYTFSKNHMQFFFEEAWGGSADICLDDITLTNTATGEIVYQETFDITDALAVRWGNPTQTRVQEQVGQPTHYLQMTGASSYCVKTEDISLEANAEYMLSYEVKLSNVTGSVYFYTWRQEWDDVGNYSGVLAITDGITTATDGWQTVEASFTAGKNNMQLFFEQAWPGNADICLDNIKLTKIDSEPVETEPPATEPPAVEPVTMETTLSFNRVDKSADNTWYLNAANVSDIIGSYYFATVKVDGADQKIVLEKNDAGFVIYGSFFTTYGGASVPQSSFQIPEGTVLYQFDPNVSWNDPISGGQQIVITRDFNVASIGGGWYEYDIENDQTAEPAYINIDAGGEVPVSVTGPYEIKKWGTTQTFTAIPSQSGTYDIVTLETDIAENAQDYTNVAADAGNPDVTLSLKKADDTSWQFIAAGELTADSSGPRYYKMSAVIDGAQADVLVEVPVGQTYFEIYTGFFTAYGGKKPASSFAVAAGTVLKRVDSSTFQELAGGDSLHITRDFLVEITKSLTCKQVVLYKTGDANGDNAVNLVDLVAMKKAIHNFGTASQSGAMGADVNTSGAVDAMDLLALRSSLLGKTTLAKSKADAMLGGVMPIIGFDGPNYDDSRNAAGYAADFITPDIYRLIKEAGINTVVANGNEVGGNLALAMKNLQLAQDYGIRVYLNNAYVSYTENGAYASNPSVDLDAITAAYAAYSSFAGYYIYDEPYKASVPSWFGDADRMVIGDFTEPFAYLGKYANVSGYMNLFPCISTTLMWELDTSITQTTISEAKYKAYLTAASDAGADYISYDLYLRENGDANYANKKQGFYKNLEWANAVGQAEGKPFYAFIQVGTDFVTGNSGVTSQRNLTTVQEMYLEANAALAMGARGLNYYSLIQPVGYAKNSDGSYDLYRSGLINLAGNANNGAGGANYEYYNAAKKINTYVAMVDEVLMNAVHQGIISTDSAVQGYLSSDITAYKSLASVTGSTSALVGCFDYYTKEAYFVVNTSCDGGGTGSTQTVTLNFADNVSYTVTGMDCNTVTGSGNAATFTLDAGQSVLVVLD